MKKFNLVYILSVLSTIFLLQQSASAFSAPSFVQLAKKSLPTVVSITVVLKQQQFNNQKYGNIPPEFQPFFKDLFKRKQNKKGQNRPRISQGSGVIFKSNGYIITNNHVVFNAKSVNVTLNNGDKYEAKIVGTDPLTDLAVLKLVGLKKSLSYLELGDSDKIKVGEWVVAIGNPLGLGGTVTKGIISARGRNIQSGLYDDYIQTDAPINKGNSGGPLIDMKGKVIGINSVIISSTGGSIGLGFAIPSNLVKSITQQLINNGSVRRGWLGISMRSITPEIMDSLGLRSLDGILVAGIQKGGPAHKGGLEVGDIIYTFDSKRITKRNRLPKVIASSKLNKKIRVGILRSGKSKSVYIKLIERTKKTSKFDSAISGNSSSNEEVLLKGTGITVVSLTNSLRNKYKLSNKIKGVLVTKVKRGSTASGIIRVGSIISRINNYLVRNLKEAKKVISLANKKGKRNILLVLETGSNSKLFVTIPLKRK